MNSAVIYENYKRLENLVKDKTVTPENVGEALSHICPGTEKSALIEICGKMENGVNMYNELYAQYGDLDNNELSKKMLDRAVAGMNEEERKGFFLNCFEGLAENDGQNTAQPGKVSAADLASLNENELRDIISEQWRNNAEKQTFEAFVKAAEDEKNADMLMAEEPLLLAAAQYAAVLNGFLPEECAQPPELLGANAAAYKLIASAVKAGHNVNIKKMLVGAAIIIGGIALTILLGPVFGVAGDLIFNIADNLFWKAFGNNIFIGWIFHVAKLLEILVGMLLCLPGIVAILKGSVMVFEEIKNAVNMFYQKLVEKFAAFIKPIRVANGIDEEEKETASHEAAEESEQEEEEEEENDEETET